MRMKKALIIIGSPIWASLLLGGVIVAVTLFAVMWVVDLVFWSVDLACALAAPASVVIAVIAAIDGNYMYSLMYLVAACAFALVAVLFFLGSRLITKASVYLTCLPFGRNND